MLQKKVINILKENERIDDLQIANLKIIQNPEWFCFGIDSVILANFANDIKEKSKIIDLGTGTGILGFLIYGKNNVEHITGIEIQSEVAEMTQRSIKLNKLENKFNIINCDVKEITSYVDKESYDVVITNPPYKKINTGGRNEDEKKLISRHEIKADIYDFINASKKVLKDKGSLYLVHRPERLSDIMCALNQNKIEPKRIRFVYSKENSKEAKLVLIKAVKNGGKFLKIENPLYIYKENGEYTEEIIEFYKNQKIK